MGNGVQKDLVQAVSWYHKAAENGDAVGQNNLSNCYEIGIGTAVNLEQALYWRRKAAQQGQQSAIDSLPALEAKIRSQGNNFSR